MPDPKARLRQIADQLCIGAYKRHVFFCVGGKCAEEKDAVKAWEVLKKELKDRNISLSTGPNACFRTKVDCLRVCEAGPVLLVYPDGTWYSGMTADRIPKFVEQHLINNQPVLEWIFAANPLPADPDDGGTALDTFV